MKLGKTAFLYAIIAFFTISGVYGMEYGCGKEEIKQARKKQNTPYQQLIWAVANQNDEQIKDAILKGVSPNQSFRNPLVYAITQYAKTGDDNLIRFLIYHGANPEYHEGPFSVSPMSYAYSYLLPEQREHFLDLTSGKSGKKD